MKTKWILKCVNALAVVLILASVAVLLRVVFTPADQVPQVFGYSVFRVLSGSMEPAIPRDALLVVEQTDPKTIEAGDVISFFSPDPTLGGAVNTHRVTRVEQTAGELQFYTKGDANYVEDAYPVSSDMLVGKVVFVSGALGRLVTLLSNPLVFAVAIFLPLLIILLWNLWHTIRIALDAAKKEEAEAVRQALEARKDNKEAQKNNEKT